MTEATEPKEKIFCLMNLFINWGMNILKIKYMDIVRKASYGACDKPALRWSRVARTLLPPGHNVLHSPI
jgi:hypothetical protein